MCIATPMKVIEANDSHALCDDRGEIRRIDTMLVGPQEPGNWLLVFIDGAREVISEDTAKLIMEAHDALAAAMSGAATDSFFQDIGSVPDEPSRH